MVDIPWFLTSVDSNKFQDKSSSIYLWAILILNSPIACMKYLRIIIVDVYIVVISSLLGINFIRVSIYNTLITKHKGFSSTSMHVHGTLFIESWNLLSCNILCSNTWCSIVDTICCPVKSQVMNVVFTHYKTTPKSIGDGKPNKGLDMNVNKTKV